MRNFRLEFIVYLKWTCIKDCLFKVSWRLLLAKDMVMKWQNIRDSSQWTISKFVWLLGKHKVSSLSSRKPLPNQLVGKQPNTSRVRYLLVVTPPPYPCKHSFTKWAVNGCWIDSMLLHHEEVDPCTIHLFIPRKNNTSFPSQFSPQR